MNGQMIKHQMINQDRPEHCIDIRKLIIRHQLLKLWMVGQNMMKNLQPHITEKEILSGLETEEIVVHRGMMVLREHGLLENRGYSTIQMFIHIHSRL